MFVATQSEKTAVVSGQSGNRTVCRPQQTNHEPNMKSKTIEDEGRAREKAKQSICVAICRMN